MKIKYFLLLLSKVIMIILPLIIIILPSASALYAGTNNIYHIDSCYNAVNINVTANNTIVTGEYNLVGCAETYANYWLCPCNGVYDVVLNTTMNTINQYYFTIQWFSSLGLQVTHVSSGSGGGISDIYIPVRIINNTINNTITINASNNISVTNLPIQEIISKNVESNLNPIVINNNVPYNENKGSDTITWITMIITCLSLITNIILLLIVIREINNNK